MTEGQLDLRSIHPLRAGGRLNDQMNPEEAASLWLQCCKKHGLQTEGFWALPPSFHQFSQLQGWKVHVSASPSCALTTLEKAVPIILAYGLPFKVIANFDDIAKLNCGLYYGYSQIGKVITVYISDDSVAKPIAQELAVALRGHKGPVIPSDERFAVDAPVFFRYGAFSSELRLESDGKSIPAIRTPEGQLLPDRRRSRDSIPYFLTSPFGQVAPRSSFYQTPLGTRYLVYEALSQRGKGGVYLALDTAGQALKKCIIKEGRANGESIGDLVDGRCFINQEIVVLTHLHQYTKQVPQLLDTFEACGNKYAVMEHVDGAALYDLLQTTNLPSETLITIVRSFLRAMLALEAAKCTWRDCKPHNIIVKSDNEVVLLDFEGALLHDLECSFPWGSKGYFPTTTCFGHWCSSSQDVFAAAMVIYQVLTGLKTPLINAIEQWAAPQPWVPFKFFEMLQKFICGEDVGVKRDMRELHSIFARAF